MRYIYGPVKSRRLGLSLGVSLTLHKTCNFDCLYCQLGRTPVKTQKRGEYIKAEDIIGEVKLWFENNPSQAAQLDFVTISGSGEPTLNIKIGELIQEIRKITPARLAVITNASLLSDAALRSELLGADLLVPSLDAVIPSVFERIDRPHPGIKIEDIKNGLVAFRKEFKGEIWLEV
ncbi:MAG: radical SAM protein, partial [Candidatus Omnitrophica bacterium]|nr:radical SAM protein [Candidatus Omnitrophota bacterium]